MNRKLPYVCIKHAQRGVVATAATLILAVVVFFLISFSLVSMSMRERKLALHVDAQANNVARAGLVDALAWFRRQGGVVGTGQPNTHPTRYADSAFNPTGNNTTLNSTLGLVKEYQLSENNKLWCRYEIARQANPYPSTKDPAYNKLAAHDISEQRTTAAPGSGTVWSLTSKGYVYRREKAPPHAFDASPNVVISRATAMSEIRRLTVNLPTAPYGQFAAVTLSNNGRLTLNGRAVVDGQTTAFGFGTDRDNAPKVVAPAKLLGYADWTKSMSNLGFINIFSVSPAEIRALADINVNSVNEIKTYPAMGLVVINGPLAATFNDAHPLKGGGILIVNTDLTVYGVAPMLFSGLIYVRGNVTLNSTSFLSGALLAEGNVVMNDEAQVMYDPDALLAVQQQIATYRESRSSVIVQGGQ